MLGIKLATTAVVEKLCGNVTENIFLLEFAGYGAGILYARIVLLFNASNEGEKKKSENAFFLSLGG